MVARGIVRHALEFPVAGQHCRNAAAYPEGASPGAAPASRERRPGGILKHPAHPITISQEHVMRRPVFALLAIALVPSALSAQAAASAAPAPSPRFGVEAIHGNWKVVTDYLTRAAEQMPEADYAFKAAPTVRSCAEVIGHVAGSQNMFCAAALGEKVPAEDEIEKNVKGKAALVAALKKSNEYCERAHAQTDAALVPTLTLFGQQFNRMGVLALNAVHHGEHYGQLVTYLRIKGMVPPSSQPAQ